MNKNKVIVKKTKTLNVTKKNVRNVKKTKNTKETSNKKEIEKYLELFNGILKNKSGLYVHIHSCEVDGKYNPVKRKARAPRRPIRRRPVAAIIDEDEDEDEDDDDAEVAEVAAVVDDDKDKKPEKQPEKKYHKYKDTIMFYVDKLHKLEHKFTKDEVLLFLDRFTWVRSGKTPTSLMSKNFTGYLLEGNKELKIITKLDEMFDILLEDYILSQSEAKKYIGIFIKTKRSNTTTRRARRTQRLRYRRIYNYDRTTYYTHWVCPILKHNMDIINSMPQILPLVSTLELSKLDSEKMTPTIMTHILTHMPCLNYAGEGEEIITNVIQKLTNDIFKEVKVHIRNVIIESDCVWRYIKELGVRNLKFDYKDNIGLVKFSYYNHELNKSELLQGMKYMTGNIDDRDRLLLNVITGYIDALYYDLIYGDDDSYSEFNTKIDHVKPLINEMQKKADTFNMFLEEMLTLFQKIKKRIMTYGARRYNRYVRGPRIPPKDNKEHVGQNMDIILKSFVHKIILMGFEYDIKSLNISARYGLHYLYVEITSQANIIPTIDTLYEASRSANKEIILDIVGYKILPNQKCVEGLSNTTQDIISVDKTLEILKYYLTFNITIDNKILNMFAQNKIIVDPDALGITYDDLYRYCHRYTWYPAVYTKHWDKQKLNYRRQFASKMDHHMDNDDGFEPDIYCLDYAAKNKRNNDILKILIEEYNIHPTYTTLRNAYKSGNKYVNLIIEKLGITDDKFT
jgi:hypothetical protein